MAIEPLVLVYACTPMISTFYIVVPDAIPNVKELNQCIEHTSHSLSRTERHAREHIKACKPLMVASQGIVIAFRHPLREDHLYAGMINKSECDMGRYSLCSTDG